MDRRDFIKTTGSVIAGATLAPSVLVNAMPPSASGRLVLPMNRNWLFNPSVPEGSHERGFDDSGYQRIVIPHTNVRLPCHSFAAKSNKFFSTYRRNLNFPL